MCTRRLLIETMQMDVLRCKTPELVHNELWTHILAYNLIRSILAQAAHKHDLQPRTLSFKGAIQLASFPTSDRALKVNTTQTAVKAYFPQVAAGISARFSER